VISEAGDRLVYFFIFFQNKPWMCVGEMTNEGELVCSTENHSRLNEVEELWRGKQL
jgi:hypothetical protein